MTAVNILMYFSLPRYVCIFLFICQIISICIMFYSLNITQKWFPRPSDFSSIMLINSSLCRIVYSLWIHLVIWIASSFLFLMFFEQKSVFCFPVTSLG